MSAEAQPSVAANGPAQDGPSGEGAASGAEVGSAVVRGGVQRTISFAFVTLASAVTAVILLRYLGVDDFGRYGTVLALVGIVYGVSEAGLSLTGIRELSLQGSRTLEREVLAHVLALRVLLTGVGVLLAVGFALVAGYETELVIGTAVAGLGIFLISLQSAMVLPLSVEMRNGTLALNEAIRQGLILAGVAIAALLGAGLVPVLAVQVFAGIVLIAVTPLLISRHHLVAPSWNPRRLRELVVTGLPVAVASVLGVIYLQFLIIAMSLLSDSAAQTGYFVASTRVIQAFAGLPFLLVTVVLPVLTLAARDDRDRLNYVTSRTTETMAVGGTLLAVFLVLAARPIISVVGGSSYGPASDVLRIQAAASVTIFLVAAWIPTMLGLNKGKEFALSVGAGLAALLVSAFLLIPQNEAIGAAQAAVLGDLVYALAMGYFLWSAGPGRQLPASRLFAVLLIGAVITLLGLVVVGPSLACAVIASAVFIALLLIFRLVPEELVEAVTGGARRAGASLMARM